MDGGREGGRERLGGNYIECSATAIACIQPLFLPNVGVGIEGGPVSRPLLTGRQRLLRGQESGSARWLLLLLRWERSGQQQTLWASAL